MIPAAFFLVLSILLFVLGVVAFFIKRDLITMFMAVEIMLNAANLAFLTFAKSTASLDGQVIVFFVVTVAAAESAVGLAIILLVFKRKKSIQSDDLDVMKS
jgi:NADH-quinone oxidoreductase subunit K